jgi:phosphopantetheinyl transferase
MEECSDFMAIPSNNLNFYLVNTDSDFADEICAAYPINQSSQKKLDGRITPIARRQFIVSRALLAYILKRDWGIMNSTHSIDDSAQIPVITSDQQLYLSLSHSAKFVVVAVAKEYVAVDLEVAQRMRNYFGIAERAFHQMELKFINATKSHDQAVHNFYKVWTTRECFYKLGMLDSLSNKSFNSNAEIIKGGISPFYYSQNNIYLTGLAPKSMQSNLIQFV